MFVICTVLPLIRLFCLLLIGRTHLVAERGEQIIDIGVLMRIQHPVIFLAQVNEHIKFLLTAEQQGMHRQVQVWNEFHSLEWTP